MRLRAISLILLIMVTSITVLIFKKTATYKGALAYLGGRSRCGFVGAIKAANHRANIVSAERALLARQHRCVQTEAGMELWETAAGRFWVNSGSDVREFGGMIGEQDEDIYGLNTLPRGAVVLDCGASYGIVTRKALASGAGLVVAIEPDPDIVSCLRRTFSEEIAAGRVVIVPKGVWDREDVLTLQRFPGHTWGDSFTGINPGISNDIPAPLTTIDQIVSNLYLQRVDFIKMDIEGAEEKALIGARKTILRDHPRMAVCLYHGPDDHKRIPALVRSMAPYRVDCPCKEWYGAVVPDVALFK